jgi:ribosomal protein S18 acetylase RimI-like enzyme
MRIRPYEPNDWPRLCEIHDRARVDELRYANLSEAFLSLEQTADGEGLFDGTVAVAEVGGRVEGFVAFTEGELTWLYVDPESYRQGIGTALLREAIQMSAGALGTEVLVGNDAALRLYLAEGFVVQRRADGKLAGNERFDASGYILRREQGEA